MLVLVYITIIIIIESCCAAYDSDSSSIIHPGQPNTGTDPNETRKEDQPSGPASGSNSVLQNFFSCSGRGLIFLFFFFSFFLFSFFIKKNGVICGLCQMRSRHHPSILHGASSPHYYLLDYVLRLLSFIIIIIDYVPNINLGPVSSAGPFWDSFLYHHRRSPLPARSSSFIGCRLYYISIESQTIY